MLLDEPTAGMGDHETYEITRLIRRLHRDSNFTIVLIEHDMRVVFHLADRISVLDQGKLLAEGSPQEIADKYGFELKLVRDIALLVDRNEYKRKQAAPGLKITSRAFGFGRPFPIAQRFVP